MKKMEDVKPIELRPAEVKMYLLAGAAKYLGVSKASIRKWRYNGKIKCVKSGGELHFDESELERIKAERRSARFERHRLRVVENTDDYRSLVFYLGMVRGSDPEYHARLEREMKALIVRARRRPILRTSL